MLYTREMSSVLEEREKEEDPLQRAQDMVQALITELSMHEDAQAQVGALHKKIASTKERARGLVNTIDKRIAHLSEMWEKQMANKGGNEDLEIAKAAVSEPVRIGLNRGGDDLFFTRVNALKDKVAELVQLDQQAADAHKKAAADNKTLNMAADMLREVEDRQRVILALNDHCYSEETHPVVSIRRAIHAIDVRLRSESLNEQEKKDLEKLAKDLRVFLTGLPDHGSCPTTPRSVSDTHTELRVNFQRNNTDTSTGISGTTVGSNMSSSEFTTSSWPSTTFSTLNNKNASANQKPTPSQKDSTNTPSTLQI